MKKTAILAAGLSIAAAASTAVLSSALGATSTKPTGGQIQAFGTPALSGTTGTILITGAIGDYGKTVKIDKAGRPDANGAYSKLELHKGTIVLDGTTLDKQIQAGSAHAHLNPVSCSLEGSLTAPAPIISGTGAYAGATGTIKVTFTLAELAPTYTSGAKQGQCNTSNGPDAEFATIRGIGTVSFK
jgi:hypothetical protein